MVVGIITIIYNFSCDNGIGLLVFSFSYIMNLMVTIVDTSGSKLVIYNFSFWFQLSTGDELQVPGREK